MRAALTSLPAYLDAGSGSMILQLILGGTAAVVVSVKLWWHRVLELLRIRRRASAATGDSEAKPG